MKKIIFYIYNILMINILSVVFVIGQTPTHYPEANDPIPPTLVNLLIYVGGPILMFLIYYYYRKSQKKKQENKKQDIQATHKDK